MIKRLINEEQKKKLKDLKKYKGRKISSLSQSEKDDLLEIIAKKLNLI
jgi:hypothetical protein